MEGNETEVATESWGDALRQSIVDDQPAEESDIEETEEVEPEEDNEEAAEPEEIEEDDPDVDLGDGKKAVKMSELKQGYLRQSDYTKKTQEIATQRKELEAEKESLQDIKEWKTNMESNPWLWERINEAIKEFNNTGLMPLEEVLQDAESGKYINHLWAENNSLRKQLEGLQGEYEGAKLSADMTRLSNALKEEYGDMVTDDYMQSLQERGKNEKLSTDTLKEIAEGHLAKQALKQNKQDVQKVSKKAEARAIQTLAETKNTAPKHAKPSTEVPSNVSDSSSMNWFDALKAAAKG